MQRYVVGFTIFEGKSLVTEDGNPCDTFVTVECCNLRFHTLTLEGKDALAIWKETNIWPDIDLYQNEFDGAYIEFSVYARYWWTRNYLIGKQQLELSFINKRRHHLYARRDLVLRREDSPVCTGTLEVTVFCLKPGEHAPSQAQMEEKPEELDEDGDEGRAALENINDLSLAVQNTRAREPAGIPQHLIINVHRVDDLRDIQGDAPSPYVTVHFAGINMHTTTATREHRYDFNTCFQIPVITPIYEDRIVIKIWSSYTFSADALLAEGFFSFSELRNEALAPRWFNLYGLDPNEAPDFLSLVTPSGAKPPDNTFLGRILISARIQSLDDGEVLEKAKKYAAQAIEEPAMLQMVLLADVFMVTGAPGRMCRVDMGFKAISGSTQEVAQEVESVTDKMNVTEANEGPSRYSSRGDDVDRQEAGEMDEEEEEQKAEEQDINSFWFTQEEGRIKPLSILTNEDVKSQARVLISVFTSSYLRKAQRVGTKTLVLNDVPWYQDGAARKPDWVALDPMPGAGTSESPPSVLLNLERRRGQEESRQDRKHISRTVYLVRAYCFMARALRYEGLRQDTVTAGEYALRVACAGMSITTRMKPGPRPLWMQALDLKVVLFSDSDKQTPTIEPITLTIIESGTLYHGKIGNATCRYTHLRKKDAEGRWEPYRLEPQWVKVAGEYGHRAVGEALVAFDLLQWKAAQRSPEIAPRNMWPHPLEEFRPTEHFMCLRPATLYFSILGLRDIRPLANVESLGMISGKSEVNNPRVTVEVSQLFDSEAAMRLYGAAEAVQNKPMVFLYKPVVDGGCPTRRADRMRTWYTKTGLAGDTESKNFEFLQTQKVECLIPDRMLLQPFITIRVEELPSSWGETLGYGPALVGESRQSLSEKLPCGWFNLTRFGDINTAHNYAKQKASIQESMSRQMKLVKAREGFQQRTEEDLEVKKQTWKKQEDDADTGLSVFLNDDSPVKSPARQRTPQKYGEEADVAAGFNFGGSGNGSMGPKSTSSLPSFESEDEDLDDTGLPYQLKDKPGQVKKRPLKIKPTAAVNMEQPRSFSPRWGERFKTTDGSAAQKEVKGTLESQKPSTDAGAFVPDFWYASVPLLRNQDFEDGAESSVDWHSHLDLTFGFVKCCFKLVDGWGEEELALPFGETQTSSSSHSQRKSTKSTVASRNEETHGAADGDVRKLMQSFEFSEELDKFAFNEKKLVKRYKDEDRSPAQLRLRVYFVKAVCIFGKGSGFADPYIDYQFGSNQAVSQKNMAQYNTTTPTFYRPDERTICLPEDGRLEVRLMDLGAELARNDTLIGSTVIDLEDRWHSTNWRRWNGRGPGVLPKEHRPLFSAEEPGKVRGTIEMWVEMVSLDSDIPAYKLAPPPATEIEIRVVIWSTTNIKIVSGDSVNIMITTSLDCKEFNGHQESVQTTDVHWNSKSGRGVFNYRMVYSHIVTPTWACNLGVRVYHHETLTGDTSIGSFDLDLKKYTVRVVADLERLEVGPSDIRLSSRGEGGGSGRDRGPSPATPSEDDEEDLGTVNMTVYVLCQSDADSHPQGMAREEPNDDPQLFTPTDGRDWSTYIDGLGLLDWLPDFKGMWKKLMPIGAAISIFFVMLMILRAMSLLN